MSETQRFERFPAIRLWIKNILQGSYSNEDNSFFTIFGKTKRVRIVATIIEKREILNPQPTSNEMTIDEDEDSNIRLEFDLDDGTGLIRAILWRANPDLYKDFEKGTIVDVVGLLRRWKEYTSLSPEIIRKIKGPNFILLRNAEIIKKIKSGEIYRIPTHSKEESEKGDSSNEIDIDDLFEGEQENEIDDIKEKVYNLIENQSKNGEGISFIKLLKMLNIPEEDLRKFLKDLEMESKIYQSEANIYQSF